MTDQTKRDFYLDNLKSALIVLVVCHHAADTYAGSDAWPYQPTEHATELYAFLGVNAAFFMGLFFFVSALFHPGSVDRKGVGRFLLERMRRLGIPLVVYCLTVVPVLMYVYHTLYRDHSPISFSRYYFEIFLGFGEKPVGWNWPAWPDFNFLHMWFVEHLVLSALLYGLWRRLRPAKSTPPPETPIAPRHAHACLLSYTVALIVVTALIEISYPQNRWIGLFGFIQMEPFHMPQYASMFVLGLVAMRRNWLRRLPASVGYAWLGLAVALALLVYVGRPLGLSLGMFYVPWQAFVCTSMCVGLLVLFREHVNGHNPLSETLAANAYAVYIIHFPVVVAFQHALDPIGLHPLLATVIVAILAVPTSFAVSHYGLRKLPYVDKVL